MKMVAALLMALAGSAASAADLFVDPKPLNELLGDGYEIVAVMTPNLSPRSNFSGKTFDGDGYQWKRELYLQKGAEAAFCIFVPLKLSSDCYSLTKGEKR